jgi:hypothetical protein
MYRQHAGEAADALRRLCWNSQYGLLADTPAQKKFSEQPNILAVWLDVIDKDQQEAVIRKILSGESGGRGSATPELSQASYYFRFYLARALEHAGLADEYLNLLGPWRNMLALGLTTWAETPEPTRSDCHAWSAHPNFDLLSIVAGIRPGSPGFGTVLIEPHLGYLKSVSVVFPHEKGTITAAYAVEPAATTADITLPPALTGELVWNGRHYTLHAGQQTLTLP